VGKGIGRRGNLTRGYNKGGQTEGAPGEKGAGPGHAKRKIESVWSRGKVKKKDTGGEKREEQFVVDSGAWRISKGNVASLHRRSGGSCQEGRGPLPAAGGK